MAFVKKRRTMSHGNLCLNNIMLTDNLGVKISFFGSSSDNSHNPAAAGMRQMKWAASCNKWMPTCLSSSKDHPTDADIDIRSFGVVMWEIFTLAQLPPYARSKNNFYYWRWQAFYCLSINTAGGQQRMVPDQVARLRHTSVREMVTVAAQPSTPHQRVFK